MKATGSVLAALVASLAAAPSAGQDFATLFAQTGIAPSSIRIEAPAAATMPLIDAHTHLNGDMPAERLIALMDRSGVEAMVLMPRLWLVRGARATDEQAAEYARRYPRRFIPLLAAMRPELATNGVAWWQSSGRQALFAYYERGLRGGAYFGIGEFILRHYSYQLASGEASPENTIRVDHETMRGVAALVAGRRIPIVIHAEAEEQAAAQAEALIGSNPGTLVVWAHNCGRASADDTARRLRRFPNLMCDLGDMFNSPRRVGGYGRGGPRPSPHVHLVQDDGGRLLAPMRRLFESFPDRFTVGTDCAHTFWLDFYRSRINQIRILLAQLSPRAARLIGRDNARAMFANALAK
jgi:hypothetical protein